MQRMRRSGGPPVRLVAGKAAFAALALAMCGRAKAVDVREFGAVGDGVADDTVAVQSAIDAGGAVRFPPGVYLVSSIYLKSGGGLELDADAVLKMQPDRSKWHIREECAKYDSFGASASHAHLVNCIGATNVFIRGGTIDGDYRSFYKREYFYQCGGRRFMKPRIRKGDPSQMVWFFESSGVVLENVRLVDAPFWALMLHGCDDVVLNGVVVEGADEILNSDGIDIDCCSRVRVVKCRVRTGDDALAVRANTYALTKPRPCEHVIVEDCDLASGYAHAIRVGVGSGEIANCRFANIRMTGTRGGIWVCSKFKGGKGAFIHDIRFEDIAMDAVCGIYVRHDYFLVPKDSPFGGELRDVRFARVRGKSMLPSAVVGNGVAKMHGIVFKDCDISVRTPADMPHGEFEFFSIGDSDKDDWIVRNADVVR